jgi:serine protease Do
MNRCPNCGAVLVAKGDEFVCPSCDGHFSADDFADKKTEQLSFSRHDSNSGEDVFSQNINGVATIECQDVGSAGSGWVYSSKGLLITNAHVVGTDDSKGVSNDIIVGLAGEQVPADVIAYGDQNSDGNYDLAILKLQYIPAKMKVLKVGDSDRLKNGETVFHIGNSLGEGLCITRGIISDKERLVGDSRLIMTDTAVNPGNSGGPLFNERGEVVGTCVSVAANARAGMKYSIPINQVLSFIKEALEK